MEDRAYHLQPLAHSAVGAALASGKLARQPCEVCAAPGHAHHDIYHPDKWLVVRWLCAKHHREWHNSNEPEWPTIYELHPSDYPDRRNPGRRGKRPMPWFHSSRGQWWVTFKGKQHNLGKDRGEAFRAVERMLAEDDAARESAL